MQFVVAVVITNQIVAEVDGSAVPAWLKRKQGFIASEGVVDVSD